MIKIRYTFNIIIFFLLSTTIYAQSDFSVNFNLNIPVVYSKYDTVAMLPQSGLNFGTSIGGIFLDTILLNGSFQFELLAASAVINGVRYSGYYNFGPSFDIGYRGKILENDKNCFYIGFLVGTGIYWAKNLNSDNYFFYPTFKTELFSDIKFKNSFYTISVYFPLEARFIKTLNYSIKSGIGLKIKFSDFI